MDQYMLERYGPWQYALPDVRLEEFHNLLANFGWKTSSGLLVRSQINLKVALGHFSLSMPKYR